MVVLRRVHVLRLPFVLRLALVLHVLHVLHFHVAIVVVFLVHFFDGPEDLLVLHLEVRLLGVLDDLVYTIYFELVSVNLRLVIFELKHHLFELFTALFEVLLVDNELFGDFWAALFR